MSKVQRVVPWIVAILFFGLFVGAQIHYNSEVTDRDTTIASLSSQVDLLQGELDSFPLYKASISNFSSDGPYSVVFGVSDYFYSFILENTGDVPIQNITLTVTLTLSDGETANNIHTNIKLDVGEKQNITSTVRFNNVSVNLRLFSQEWSIELTSLRGTISVLDGKFS